MTIENINAGYKKRGVFSPVKKVEIGGGRYLIFVSGIQAPKGEGQRVITDDIAEQTRLIFEEINKLLNLAGASLDNVIKAVIYLTDMNDFDTVSAIRGEYFKNSMPVSTVVEVNGFTRKGAKIEIEVTAVLAK